MINLLKLRIFLVLVAAAVLASIAPVPVDAHQAINPKILKMVRKGPPGTPPCYKPGRTTPTEACIEKGRKLFETGTFDGNGRTCASCQSASNNFTIDVPFINTLPSTDKLFVHEQVDALKELETPLLREYGLICENLDGFADVGGNQSCVLRSSIATEGLRASVDPDGGPFDNQPNANGLRPARPCFP